MLLVEGKVVVRSQTWARTQCPEWAGFNRGHPETMDWMGKKRLYFKM